MPCSSEVIRVRHGYGGAPWKPHSRHFSLTASALEKSRKPDRQTTAEANGLAWVSSERSEPPKTVARGVRFAAPTTRVLVATQASSNCNSAAPHLQPKRLAGAAKRRGGFLPRNRRRQHRACRAIGGRTVTRRSWASPIRRAPPPPTLRVCCPRRHESG